MFIALQALNIVRLRSQTNLSAAYITNSVLNLIALIAIGHVAFLTSIPTLIGLATSLR